MNRSEDSARPTQEKLAYQAVFPPQLSRGCPACDCAAHPQDHGNRVALCRCADLHEEAERWDGMS
ncbi:MAG TPA: hypothetical protein VH370_15165 [Humisphaera sp.]|nr:hypothetical protein [Humisphaera sp.]